MSCNFIGIAKPACHYIRKLTNFTESYYFEPLFICLEVVIYLKCPTTGGINTAVAHTHKLAYLVPFVHK